MFFVKRSYLGLGMVMGMMAGAGAVAALVLSCPQGRCMARRAYRRGVRVMKEMKPSLG